MSKKSPNDTVATIRSSSGNVLEGSGKEGSKSKNTPSAIALSRQKLPYLGSDYSEKNKCEFGAYVVNKTSNDTSLTLIASGSEVEIAVEAQGKLKEMNIESSVVSMPSQELFNQQDDIYKEKIINKNIPAITIEASSISGWEKYAKYNMGMETFGESAPYKEVYSYFNLTSDKVVELAKKIVKQ